MISVKEAYSKVFENIPSPKIIEINVSDSFGFVTAEDVRSKINIPNFTNSAMDGYAVIWENVKYANESNLELEVIGESAAGIPFKGEYTNGKAIKINTGAKVPEGFDTVIPIEDTEEKENTVVIKKVKKKNQNVRFAGEEFEKDSVIMKSGTNINPPELGLLMTANVKRIKVFDKTKVSIIVTGTELISDDSELEEGQIRESNSLMLVSSLRQIGCNINKVYKVGDSLQETINLIDDAQKQSDVIIITGGVSFGPHDHVKEASEEIGFERIFWRVSQKPGKPLYFAKKENTVLFGLPGNPVSAMMGFLYYIVPAVLHLSGKKTANNYVKAVVNKSIVNKQKRAHMMRAKIINNNENKIRIEVLEQQASHMISTLTNADGFVLVEAKEEIESNNEIKFYPFPWRYKWDI